MYLLGCKVPIHTPAMHRIASAIYAVRLSSTRPMHLLTLKNLARPLVSFTWRDEHGGSAPHGVIGAAPGRAK